MRLIANTNRRWKSAVALRWGWVGWDRAGGGELTHGGWQGDAGGAQRQARGGAGRRAQDETLPVLFDLGLGQGVEVGEDLGPGRPWRGFADRGDAVLQFLFQHQGEEAAGDVAADGLVEFVINRPRFEQALRRAERPLHRP